MKINCTCIVPLFNERTRVGEILSIALQVSEISQIICVDDGSTDNSVDFINKQFPKIKVLSLQRNLGKTAAVAYGIKYAQADLILLLDADIKGITAGEISNAISLMQADDQLDMLILRRMKAPLEVKLSRSETVISGERILRKKDLLEILKTNPKGYQLETAINMYMINNRKKVFWFPCSTTHLMKRNKYGFLKGLIKEIAMHWDCMKYAGFRNYVKQFLFFAREKYPID